MPRPTTVDPTPAPGSSRRIGWTLAALALLTGVLGLLAVLAPVNADDPVVTWPQAGQPPTSTVLPLSPYRPLQLEATIPCATLRALDARGGGEALRTLPADVGTAPGEGLVVAAQGGVLTVSASGAELLRGPLPAGSCTYRVGADAGGVRVSRDGAVLATRADLLAPQVAELQTDAAPADAQGLAVRLHTDARYQSSPTALKTALLIAHGVALLALLLLAWRRWRGSGPGLVRPRLSWADAVLVVVSLAWVVLGPVNIDDSWYLLMARNAMESGYIGNVIYQFNVTENPFSTSQYAMQAWGALGDHLVGSGWSLGWMRLLPFAYGVAGYALLRVLVATVLGRAGREPAVPARTVAWALAGAYLLWWLPYGITLRPEPVISLGTAAVLVLAELARRRRSVGVLATATAVAAVTVTVSPTGLVAVAPLLLCVPWLWQWWKGAELGARVGAVLLAGAGASVVVPIGFADASLGDVLSSTAVHRWYYRQHPWYEEYLHYAHLFATDDQGAWGKRLPVLLTLAVLLVVAIGTARRAGSRGPSGRLLGTAALVTALGLASMALTPTKWVNHFDAVAAPAALLLAAALIRSPLPRRAAAPAIAVGAAVLVTAASLGYAGANMWRPFGDWGQPFGNHTHIGSPYELSLLTPAVGPLTLRNPLLWLAVAGLGWWWARRRSRPEAPRRSWEWAARRGWPGPQRAVLLGATSLGVVLMLAVFTVAPLRQFPGTSIALMNLRALLGRPCGLAPAVQVFTDAPAGLGAPIGSAQLGGAQPGAPLDGGQTGGARLDGDMREGLPPGMRPPPTEPGATVWNDQHGDAGTGSVTTPWYPLPAGTSGPGLSGLSGARIIVPVTGDVSAQQSLAVEVTAGSPTAPSRVVTLPLDPLGEQDGWAEAGVELARSGLPAPTAVRVVAEDRDADPDSWLAVGRPRLVVPRPATQVVGSQPVFADQVSAGLWACEQQIALRDGLAQPPAWRLRAADGLEGAIQKNSIFAPNGGTLVQVDRTSQFVELPSELVPPGMPTLGWGHVERVVYDHPPGLVDLQVERVRRSGWTQLPKLSGEAYTGRIYIG